MNDAARSYELVVLPHDFAVCKFGPRALVPAWIDGGNFWSVARTTEELSIVCEERLIPSGVHAETGFSCLKVVSPLDFSSVGVLAALTGALAASGISVFAISTFDTDYVLVKEEFAESALKTLQAAGHELIS